MLGAPKKTEFHRSLFQKIACKMGRIYVNGEQMTDVDYVMRNGDRVEHWAHRHEHPVRRSSRTQFSHDLEHHKTLKYYRSVTYRYA